ncbi:FAD-binding oxidoreductase [Halovulum dunhuangense]|uniref:FAD-binding oxidoreductase n=1 Tax=Halovulum dunhuangense TaxID=1505036 RepID=A0A849L4G0_9RHOB|nr:FAD-binding oxidoreductase [Halovulum dunhuangense]NNU81235.1 FAD-binding oxidoreductase [Halovulum dunhuangense]
MQLNPEPYSGWGRVLTAAGGRARPEKAAALAEFTREIRGPAIGARRSYGDAALSAQRPAVEMTRLDRLIAFDPETGLLEAEAGVRLSDILAVFAPRGWMPTTLPGTGFVTLGGAIAADVHGKNHESAGSFGQAVAEIRLIGPDGAARWISDTVEPALFRATLGGMGLTGVIESARIRLVRCPAGHVDVTERRMPDLAAYLDAFETSEATFSVGWIDATAAGPALGRGILEEAEFTTRAAPFTKPRRARSVPLDAPGFLLSGPVVRAFNAVYWRRVPASGRTRTRPLAEFFHPLDALGGWNRLYGKRGFHQFQCVLPPDAAPAMLRTMLRDIAASGLAAPLAVLKKLGDGRAGPLSFPMRGYTLAVDFPNRDRAASLIDRLIDQTVEAEGRIYLAKDSVAGPDQVAAMYPELPAFAETVRAADPEGVFATDLARRLNLRGAA